ncbi:MAG: dethiobiotin synthase [Selenomonadaceae bacterium]|nr:dethiobiotin synthase [Selenomonadaceae bacterium]MBQ7493403.1 dethiobiotin synthase [Selenomonadaceae bacterium]
MSNCIFVTGTGTDVGKTFVTALIVKKLRGMGINAGYYKFAASGEEIDKLPADAWHVKIAANLPDEKFVSYSYKESVSPHLAAQLENRPIEIPMLERDFKAAQKKFEFLVVEGSGGIICPLRWDNQRIFLADLVKRFGLPVIIVADSELGAINATVLTVEYLRAKNIPTRGVVLNRFRAENLIDVDNEKMIAALTGLPIIAKVPVNATEIFWEGMFWK